MNTPGKFYDKNVALAIERLGPHPSHTAIGRQQSDGVV